MASGSDSGVFSIWDLRSFTSTTPAASFSWHKAPITSLEWHPWESSMIAVSGSDEQLTLWDLALEADFEQEVEVGDDVSVPAQV
jgi:ribosome assembly protein RRB1